MYRGGEQEPYVIDCMNIQYATCGVGHSRLLVEDENHASLMRAPHK
jgi:hypothetical protein